MTGKNTSSFNNEVMFLLAKIEKKKKELEQIKAELEQAKKDRIGLSARWLIQRKDEDGNVIEERRIGYG